MGQTPGSQSPPPQIVQRHREQRDLAITIRGQGGPSRQVQPEQFNVSCLICRTTKDCCKVRLYTTRVLSVKCTSCSRTMVSTKWTCAGDRPWVECAHHRRLGFACGTVTASRRQFASSNHAQQHYRRYINYSRAAGLGTFGAGDHDTHKISQIKSHSLNHITKSHSSILVNSAGQKK